MIAWRRWKEEHKEVVDELRAQEARIIDQTRRLIRLEAEVGIHHPLTRKEADR